MRKFIIYILQHADSDRVYVGKTIRGDERSKEHKRQAAKSKTLVNNWKKKYPNYNTVILEEFSDASALNESEKFYIAYFKSIGMQLLNLTDGGEGTGGYSHTDEAKAKMSKDKIGNKNGTGKRSPETRSKMSNSKIGNKSRTGIPHSIETREKIGLAQQGKNRKEFEELSYAGKYRRAHLETSREASRGAQSKYRAKKKAEKAAMVECIH